MKRKEDLRIAGAKFLIFRLGLTLVSFARLVLLQAAMWETQNSRHLRKGRIFTDHQRLSIRRPARPQIPGPAAIRRGQPRHPTTPNFRLLPNLHPLCSPCSVHSPLCETTNDGAVDRNFAPPPIYISIV
jgi:hypothetical protein